MVFICNNRVSTTTTIMTDKEKTGKDERVSSYRKKFLARKIHKLKKVRNSFVFQFISHIVLIVIIIKLNLCYK